jgi:hypothetical protein
MNRGCRYLIGRAAGALFIVLLSGPLPGIDVTQLLAVSDFSKQRILTFKRTGKTEFEKVSEFAFPVLDKFNLKLADGRVFIAGLISLSDKESYSLYSRDLRSGDIQYLLPTEAKYGF